jgi:hypothetical protein
MLEYKRLKRVCNKEKPQISQKMSKEPCGFKTGCVYQRQEISERRS